MTQHPARSRSGFAGLRLVSDPRPDDESEPVFAVSVIVDAGQVSIGWTPKTADVGRQISDVADCLAAAAHALVTNQDVPGAVQRAYERKVSAREHWERKADEWEASHPWVCACSKRCKSETGLNAHRRAGGPSCG